MKIRRSDAHVRLLTPDVARPDCHERVDRDDWTLLRTAAGLSQRAGVALDLVPRVVAKELADNALDASGAVVHLGGALAPRAKHLIRSRAALAQIRHELHDFVRCELGRRSEDGKTSARRRS